MIDEIGTATEGVTDTTRLRSASSRSGRPARWCRGVECTWDTTTAARRGPQCRRSATREQMWTYTRIARVFLEQHLPFWDMEAADGC